jgi:hypothetical protein
MYQKGAIIFDYYLVGFGNLKELIGVSGSRARHIRSIPLSRY